MSKAELARKMVEKYPTLSKKELGRRLRKENPSLFKSDEAARKYIRGVTGANGQGIDQYRQTDKYIGPRLNMGRANDFRPYYLDSKRIAILSDIHIPYHDREALHLSLDWIKDFEPDCILLNGDIIDCYKQSKFIQDPEEPDLDTELSELHNFLSDIKHNFPKAKIIYKMGNHEERYERIFVEKNHVLAKLVDENGNNLLAWESITHAKKYGHEIVTNKRIIKTGKLNIVHGHEFGKSIFSPVNPARGFYLRAKCSVIGGHYHQTSEHIEKDLNDSVSGAWSTGALCDMHPAYMPLNRWNLGFACVEVEGDSFTVHNKKIMNGRIV